jgi:hypothetical protein
MSSGNRMAQTMILVAREADEQALRAAGKKFVFRIDPKRGAEQVVSYVPSLKQEALVSELDVFSRFVLALPAGFESLRDDLAIRLGDERTDWVEWLSVPTPVAEIVRRARPMWNDEVARLSDIPELGEEKTYESGFPSLDTHGFRFVLSAFMSIIGPYGSGKSLLLRQLLCQLWRLHKWTFLVTSFEERVKPRYRRDFRRHLIGGITRRQDGSIACSLGTPVEDWTDRDVIHADAEIEQAAVFCGVSAIPCSTSTNCSTASSSRCGCMACA